LDAGYKVNVIPSTATAGVDGPGLPGGEELFARTMDELTGPRAEWEYAHHSPPSQAPVASALLAAARAAPLAEAPGAHVVPACMTGGADAKQFAELGIAGCGFPPLLLPPAVERDALFHGGDERVPEEALRFGVRVLSRLLSGAE